MSSSSNIPSTVEEILATATMDPSFDEAYSKKGRPPGFPGLEVDELKKMVDKHLPILQSKLAADRSDQVIETEHTLPLDTGFQSRTIVCQPSAPSTPCPVIVLFHGGGYCLAFPETEIELARELVKAHSAVVVCPSVRLAPENPFPIPMEDGWAALKYIAAELVLSHNSESPLFLQQVDPKSGFIVGGTSSGAHMASVASHLAQSSNLCPPVTGQFLSVGGFLPHSRVPEKYRSLYLSWEQNKDAPMVNRTFLEKFQSAVAPDLDSPLWVPFNQLNPNDAPGQVKMGHMGQPPAYFQVCGMDINRDESLIYERVLREECYVPTKVDLYRGFPHCFWNEYSNLDMSAQRMRDSVDGIGWLLKRNAK
ncbi:Alpha/Beta hydrolase protein [Dactylonectria macrodidyma]|uniref:Alpha/Beta hydrolase protein n=1 Tax=Dactylonectria macrodidyma TaxID=307937 RepID=A0A9P9J6E1_9HYPO|nr:Alpha/Beta hydrolase protein [Dactylonectria macrodidyma]